MTAHEAGFLQKLFGFYAVDSAMLATTISIIEAAWQRVSQEVGINRALLAIPLDFN